MCSLKSMPLVAADTALEGCDELLAATPSGEPSPLAPPLESDGESERDAPQQSKIVVSRTVSNRKSELEYRRWRHDVNLFEFREQTSDLFEQLVRKPSNLPPDLDISTDGCRTLGVQETLAEGIRHSVDKMLGKDGSRLLAEPEAERLEAAELPAAKRLRVTEAIPTMPDGTPCKESRAKAQHRKLATKTASGELVVEEEKKSMAMRRTWIIANQNSSVHFAHLNALGGDAHSAHRRSTQRLEDGLSVSKRMSPTRASTDDMVVTVHACNTLGYKEQEFDVLASQPLSALRDAFYFVSDFMFDGPRRLSSACFFIDGIFYVDRRDDSALDYSEGLIPWIKSTRPSTLRSEKSMSMETRLCDLERIPFGERCIYIHQGDVEHTVMFTSARLLHPERDCPFVEAYPVLTFMRRFNKRKCLACTVLPAIWLILDATRCPHNPCFTCGKCFRHFFQDANGEFLPPVDYKIFPYLHDE